MRNNEEESILIEQARVYNQRWTWDYRINQWNNLLNELSTAISATNTQNAD